MGIGGWFADNSFNLLSVIGVVVGLWFTASSIRADTKTRRISNLLTITGNHRELWKVYLTDKALTRVLDASTDTTAKPVTEAEQIFVTLVVSHINTVFYATRDQLVVNFDGISRDVSDFFSLPIPSTVWKTIKDYQDADFVAFIESCVHV